MKVKVYPALLAIAVASGMAGAAVENELPYVAPIYCPSVISVPDGASVYYRSESCNTVYVLPPAAGALEYKIRLDSMNDLDCDVLDESRADRRRLNAKKVELEEAAFKPGVSEAKLKVYEKQIELAQKTLADLDKNIKYLAGLAGATMSVRLSAEQVEEVERFFRINKDPFRDGVNFEPAPIAESYVSFDVGDENTAATRPAVIYTNIPGVEVRGIKSAPLSDSRIMNGGVSGKVVLGVNAICNMRAQAKLASIHDIEFKPGVMESYVPANLTYSVPVMSSYQYTASMEYDLVVTDLFEQMEKHPDKFNVEFVKNHILTANGGANIKWDFKAFELQNRGVSSEELKEIETREKDAVFAEWARMLADHLVGMGVLEKLEPTPKAAPAPGTEEETHYRQMCRSKSFAGVRYSHRCWNEPYRVVRLRGSSAQNVIESLRKLNLQFTQDVKYSQPIFRTHTSTFKYRDSRKENQ